MKPSGANYLCGDLLRGLPQILQRIFDEPGSSLLPLVIPGGVGGVIIDYDPQKAAAQPTFSCSAALEYKEWATSGISEDIRRRVCEAVDAEEVRRLVGAKKVHRVYIYDNNGLVKLSLTPLPEGVRPLIGKGWIWGATGHDETFQEELESIQHVLNEQYLRLKCQIGLQTLSTIHGLYQTKTICSLVRQAVNQLEQQEDKLLTLLEGNET